MALYPKVLVPASFVAFWLCFSAASFAQISHADPVQVKPPLLRTIDPPSPDTTPADLEARADELHAQKLYFDAIDYYRAALRKTKVPTDEGKILNKICRTQLVMTRWQDGQRTCQQAIKADRALPDPYNNLGVALYEQKKYGAAIKQYRKAITLDESASFYSNLGAALFSKKQFDESAKAYQRALELDPDVFERSSRQGVQAQVPRPEDRARYDYTVAKLYAKMGFSDRSLEYLRKALEEGYKDVKNVYKDEEFAGLRKDKRFTELMAAKNVALPE
ncbi:MAG TPA: tetratricopeptide repeat protein [Candidatus Binatia bacterium]|nr:tetratricopeptide repeat protein [Candidatus Binatia bacterium]